MTGALPVPAHGDTHLHEHRFATVFRAGEAEAREALKAVMQALQRAGFDPVRAGEVEIALTEAVNNVIEHAYDGTGGGLVRLNLALRRGVLVIRISDTGRPLPGGCLPPGHPANLSVPRGELPEGGFGWFLIRTLADHVRHERRDGTNMLWLRFDP